MERNFKVGFAAALDRVPRGEVKKVKTDIMNILGIKSKTALWHYQVGNIIPDADKAQKIIMYFENIGIYDVYK